MGLHRLRRSDREEKRTSLCPDPVSYTHLYDEARDGGEKYSAEEWIVDDMALNKSKTKLAPICGKFRQRRAALPDNEEHGGCKE